jgi:predicted phage terminase large subunit-like protein
VVAPARLPSRDEVIAEQCRRSLRRFVSEAWPIVEPVSPLITGWHLDVVCEHLQAVSDGDLLRLIINVPPRTAKSLMTAVMWPAWEWLSRPHTRWLYASYAEDFAHRDSLKTRRVIKSEGGRTDGTLLQRVGYQGVLRLLSDEPWSLTKDQDAKSKFENTATGMRLATGVRGRATGEGGDRVVVDDPLNAAQARSDADREFANRWWDETMTTRFNNARAAAVIVMQRLHQDDLTGHLIEQGGWHHLCLPAEYEPTHQFVYPSKVRLSPVTYNLQTEEGKVETVTTPGGRILAGDPRTEEGELLEPVRLSTERLAELRRGLGSYGFAGQMLQRPAPAEGGMFKKAWWKYWEPATLPTGWERIVDSWDMRFGDSQEASSSYVVGQRWGVVGADFYLLGQVRARLSFTETLAAVRAMAVWRPGSLNAGRVSARLVEKKANGAAVIDTLKREITALIPIEPEGGKDVRAAAVSPTVEAGNVWLPDSDFIPCPSAYTSTSVEDFIAEHAVFPNGTHDDQVDAMSQLINWANDAPGPASSKESHPWR